jgi:ribosomal protein L39E
MFGDDAAARAARQNSTRPVWVPTKRAPKTIPHMSTIFVVEN